MLPGTVRPWHRLAVRPLPLVALLSALAGFLLPGPAEAADGDVPPLPEATLGLDTMRFRPAVSPSGGAMAEGAAAGEGTGFDAGLTVSFARREVVFTDAGEPADPVVSARLAGVLRVGATVRGRLRVALDLPLALAQSGVHPVTGEALPPGGVGDLTITAQATLLDPQRRWLGVAIGVPVSFPTGRVAALLGEPGPTIAPRVVLEKRLDFPRVPLLDLTLFAQAGWQVRPRTALLDLDTAGALVVATGIRWDPIPRLGLSAEIVGAIGRGANGRHAEWLSALRVVPDRAGRVAVRAGAGLGLTRAVGTPEARLFVGVAVGLPIARPPTAVAEPAPMPSGGATPPAVAARAAEPPHPGQASPTWGLRLVGRQADLDVRLLFEHDSARLRSDARDVLAGVLGWMLAHDGELLVSGHADPRGSDPHNDALSAARAKTVADFLVRAGLPPERVRTEAFGERAPLPREPAPTAAASWATSRRVELRLVAPSPTFPSTGAATSR